MNLQEVKKGLLGPFGPGPGPGPIWPIWTSVCVRALIQIIWSQKGASRSHQNDQNHQVYDSLPPHSAWNQQSPLSRKLAKEGRLVAIIRFVLVLIKMMIMIIKMFIIKRECVDS